MIDQALNCIVEELNRYLKRRLQSTKNLVLMGPLLDTEGKIPIGNQNKLVVSLIKLEPDTTHNTDFRRTGGSQIIAKSPYYFQLDVLISSLFSDYKEGLRCLSESSSFLQYKPVFTAENTPSLEPEIEKLSLEPLSLSYQDMHNLWGALGVKHLPAVVFKIRGISLPDGDISPEVSTIN